ncbi:DUF6130 family protein [Trinickia sp.]|uniref:DUF6130 family protein n=1 Tax=Trinickia sp. TaxID=2571163 RepID=UPI003F7FE38D
MTIAKLGLVSCAVALLIASPVHADQSPQPTDVAGAPRLVVDAPPNGAVVQHAAIIRFHTQNIRLLPVYGEAAVAVQPSIGHLHVTVDNASWHWVHVSNEPVVVQGLAPGPHTVQLELADPVHHVLDRQLVTFTVAPPADSGGHAPAH